MKLRIAALVLGVALVCGLGLPSLARAERPADATAHQLTFEEAEMLVLVAPPVLAEFKSGAPVLSQPLDRALTGGDLYWAVEVSDALGKALGFYRVDRRTGSVIRSDGQELRGPQLEAAQRIVREAHGIAIAAPAALRR